MIESSPAPTNTHMIYCRLCDTLASATDQVCSTCGFELAGSATESADLLNQLESLPGIEPFSGVGSLLRPAITVFSKNLWFITKLVFVLFAPLEIFRFLKFGAQPIRWEEAAGVWLLSMILKTLLAPALTYGLFMTLKTGTDPSLHECYRWGLRKLPTYLICSIIVNILIVLGLIALIVPGIIVFVAYLPFTPIASLENQGIRGTLEHSLYLTRGRRIPIFLAALCIMVLTYLAGVPFDFLIKNGIDIWPLQFFAAMVGDILEQSTTVLALVIYVSIVQTLRSVR